MDTITVEEYNPMRLHYIAARAQVGNHEMPYIVFVFGVLIDILQNKTCHYVHAQWHLATYLLNFNHKNLAICEYFTPQKLPAIWYTKLLLGPHTSTCNDINTQSLVLLIYLFKK